MGTDINMLAEVREAGVWRKVGRIWPCEYADDGLTDVPYLQRSYGTFAILADVRNGGRFIPIAEPRDWPDDVSPESKETHVWAEAIGYSFSWHSLRHLLEYPLWHATSIQEGVIDGPNYVAMKKGQTYMWGRTLWAGDKLVTEADMVRQLAEGNEMKDSYVRMKRDVPYHKAAEEFVTETIPRLLALASPHPDVLTMANLAIAGEKTALMPLQDWLQEHDRPGLDDVRIVFFFDD